MARTRFSPPQIAQTADQALTFQRQRSKTSYKPLVLGDVQSAPANTPMQAPAEPAEAPPAPDPTIQIRKQAHEEGYAAGLEEGKAAALAQAQQELTQLQASVEDAARLRAALAESYRQELVELSLTVAESIVQAELERGPQLAKNLVEHALQLLGRTESLRLTLSNPDAERLADWLETLGQEIEDMTVVVDEDLALGDVRLETAAGSVEVVMQQRLEQARRLVLEGVAQDNGET